MSTKSRRHVDGTDCCACEPSGLTLADLPIGTRVRVPHRQGATGTVDSVHPARGEAPDMVGIKFDGKRPGFGLNYPSQCEITARPVKVADLIDGDVFSIDGGETWHVCAVPLWGVVAVYVDATRGDDAPTVRIPAERDVDVIVKA